MIFITIIAVFLNNWVAIHFWVARTYFWVSKTRVIQLFQCYKLYIIRYLPDVVSHCFKEYLFSCRIPGSSASTGLFPILAIYLESYLNYILNHANKSLCLFVITLTSSKMYRKKFKDFKSTERLKHDSKLFKQRFLVSG